MKERRIYRRLTLPFALLLLVLNSGIDIEKNKASPNEVAQTYSKETTPEEVMAFLKSIQEDAAQKEKPVELPDTVENLQEEPTPAVEVPEEPITEETSQAQVQQEEFPPEDSSDNSPAQEELPPEEPVQEETIQSELPKTQALEPEEVETSNPEVDFHLSPMTIYVAGNAISFKEGGMAQGQDIINNAPDSLVSTYGGAVHQSGSDGQNTHFIGHNIGAFSCLLNVAPGQVITVTDSNNVPADYVIRSVRQVDYYGYCIQSGEDLYYEMLEPGTSERVTLQTCIDDHLLVVFADGI